MARTYANETLSTPIQVNLHAPGPTRTRMRAAVAPGEDPMTLPTAEAVAETIVPMCLPSFSETGRSTTSAPAGSIRSGRRRSSWIEDC